MKISVVIPTCRRRALLERCLAAVLTQTLDAADYEVIVSDDAGEPDLAHAVRALGERFGRFDLKLVEAALGEAHGPAAARNRGWRRASAAVIAFTDDDCVPSADWLENGLAALESGGADALQGRILVPLPPRPTDYALNASRLSGAMTATANFFCRRDALEAAGGFDERFRRPWREDSDLHFCLLEGGRRVLFAGEAVVVHPVRPAAWGAGLREQANSFYDALLYKKHPALYRRVIGGPPWDYYLAVLCLLAGLCGLHPALAGLRWAALAWAAWTLWFCARRLGPTSKRPPHVLEMLVTSALIPVVAVYWRLRGAAAFGVRFF